MVKWNSIGSLFCATIAVAMIAITALAPALAQNRPTQAIAADELFAGPESPDFKGGVGVGVDRLVNVVKQAQQPGSQCPTDVDFTVMGGPHPDGPLLSQALAQARRDVIEGVLRGFGPSVRVTAMPPTSGLISMVFISVQSAKDKEPPKLDTNSVPRKGTKVKAGDQIKVTMVARDDANAWQTGIKTIQLVAESDGGRFIASENFLPEAQCLVQPIPRRVEATYVVPSNPPPIVRLAALAEDFARLMDTDVGEFPTKGDWYGRFKWTHDCQGTMTDVTHGDADITLDYDGRGNLTGTLTGSTPRRTQTIPSCTMTYIAPGTFSAKLKGSYTPGPETFFVEASEGQTTPGRASFSCTYANTVNDLHFYAAYEAPMFREAFRDLRSQPDGSWKLIPDGKHTHSASGSTCTTTYSLTLNRTRN